MRKIIKLKYKDGESIVEHISAFMGYVNQLAATKFSLEAAISVIRLLFTLADSWENLVVTLSTSCKEENFSLQAVKTSILNQETRRKDKTVFLHGIKVRGLEEPSVANKANQYRDEEFYSEQQEHG